MLRVIFDQWSKLHLCAKLSKHLECYPLIKYVVCIAYGPADFAEIMKENKRLLTNQYIESSNRGTPILFRILCLRFKRRFQINQNGLLYTCFLSRTVHTMYGKYAFT